MKRIFNLLAVAALACGVSASAQKSAAGRDVNFQRYDGSYFEKNNSGLKGRTSYLAINSRARFDQVFGPAATMGQNNFLPDDAFDSKLIVAALRRGGFTSTYDVTRVTAKGGTLYVWYNVKDEPSSSATFSSPLILAVDRNNYSRVVFMEGGKRAASVPLPKSKTVRRRA